MVRQEFLDFLTSIYAVQVLLDIFLAFILYKFYRSYGRRYLLPWALSWAALSVRHMVGIHFAWFPTELPPDSFVRLTTASMSITAAFLQGAWLLEGTYELQTAKSLPFRLRRASLFFGLTIGPVLAVSSALLASSWQMILRMSFPSLLLGCAFVIAAVWVMMHGGWKRELGRRIIILAFFLYGCLRLTTFVVTSSLVIEEIRILWVFFASKMHILELFDFFLHAMMGLGMVIWLLEAERRKLLEAEERISQSQKLEAVGRLAGGIAHDFNNILTVILGYSDLLVSKLGSASGSKDAREIHRAAEKATSLTNQLLVFSRKQVLQPQIMSMNDVITGMDNMLRRLLPETIILETRLEPDLARVKADRSQMTQVVMNLVLNARDAMPSGGTLSIETSNFLTKDKASIGSSAGSGRGVLLAVEDTGVGMKEDTKSRIFEPFFTTKPLGEGTGLGLAMAYGIVEQSKGQISLRSQLGRGTRFEVLLPATEEEESEVETGAAALAVEGDETVLLVEDDDSVRQYLAQSLRSIGYDVLDVSNPKEALQLASEHQGQVALLVTDLVMPDMTGRQLAERIRDGRPNLHVVYMSGYASGDLPNGDVEEGDSILQKPFTGEVLAKKIRGALARK